MNHERVALTRVVEGCLQLRAVCVLATRPVNKYLYQLHSLEFALDMLIEGGDPDVTDKLSFVLCRRR